MPGHGVQAVPGRAAGREDAGDGGRGDQRAPPPPRGGRGGRRRLQRGRTAVTSASRPAAAGRPRRVLDQAPFDQRQHLGRRALQVRRTANHALEHRGRLPAAERLASRRGEGEHRAQAEHVAERSDRLARGLLGGHEAGRADDEAAPRQRSRLRGLGDPEIDHARPVQGQQHVGRLEVAVHDPRGVDRGQALGQARGQRQQRRDGQRPAVPHRLGQRRAAHVGGGQPGHRGVHVRVDHEGGEQAAHFPGRGDLDAEPGPELRIGGQLGVDDFHGHRPADGGHAEEYPAHAARPEPSDQLDTGRSAADRKAAVPPPRQIPPQRQQLRRYRHIGQANDNVRTRGCIWPRTFMTPNPRRHCPGIRRNGFLMAPGARRLTRKGRVRTRFPAL